MRYQPKKRSKTPFIIGAITVAVLLGLGMIFWTNGSNSAEITKRANTREERLSKYRQYDGQYIKFSHSSTYMPSVKPVKDDDLELIYLNANTNFEKNLAVSVMKLPGGDLQNNGHYKLRQASPQNYDRKELPVDAGTAVIWVKKDGFEQTAFLPNGDKVAIFAFSTVGTVDDLQSEVAAVLHSLAWKR